MTFMIYGLTKTLTEASIHSVMMIIILMLSVGSQRSYLFFEKHVEKLASRIFHTPEDYFSILNHYGAK